MILLNHIDIDVLVLTFMMVFFMCKRDMVAHGSILDFIVDGKII